MRRPDVFTLDYSHPLAQGLITAWMGRFPGVQRSFDEITGASSAIVGNAVWSDVFGRSGVYAMAAGAAVIVPRPAISASDTHTISWCINARGSSYNTGMAAYGRHFEDANMWFSFYSTTGSSVQFSVFGASGSSPLANSLYNEPTVFSIVSSPVNAKLYQDGSLIYTGTGTKTSAPAANTYLLNRADLGRTCNAGISDFLIHNRGLSDAELALLANVYNPMLGGLIVEERPVLYFYMGGSTTDELTASPLTVSSPVLGTPALGQTHALTATGITVEGPVLGAPTLAQIHALVASGLAVSAPVLGTPELDEVDENTDALFADDLDVGSPVLGTPAIGQVHALTASDLVISSPILGTPAVSDGTEQPSTRSGGGGGYASTTRKQKAKKKKPVVIESSTKSEREKIEEIARILDGQEPQEVAAQPQSNTEPVQKETSAEQPSIVAIPPSSPSPLLIASPLDLIESEAMTAARDAATQETRRVVEEQQRIAMMRMRDEDDATALIMIFASI